MSRLKELHHLFDHSGQKGHTVISDEQLKEFYLLLEELAEYMHYRNDFTMKNSLLSLLESVTRMVWARKYY